MTNRELADWLTEHTDSHGIYDVRLTYDLPTDIRARILVHSFRDTKLDIDRRGLGGHVTPSKSALVYGWEVAEAIASSRLGHNPGDAFHGRGSRWRACIAELRGTVTTSP